MPVFFGFEKEPAGREEHGTRILRGELQAMSWEGSELYRRKLKQKALLLTCMLIFLMILVVKNSDRNMEGEDQEEAEKLVIPKEEQTLQPDEVWKLPGAGAVIRVLLLGDGGGIYHKDRTLDREYSGTLEYYEEDDGWVIVNEVSLEEYLCGVVPSEMPSSYDLEALKAQAVCARTYAVWQMQEYAYPDYKAHVDDSVSYQVYNNIERQDSTDRAVKETEGQIMLYEDGPVKAYYFATSCGSTTDENIWEKGDRNLTPYIAGRRVGTSGTDRDLTDEDTFSRFIKKKHAGDLEIGEPWYRWSCYVSLDQIEKNVETWAKVRSDKSEDGILRNDGDAYVRDGAGSIGAIRSAEIIERNTGGVVHEMLLTGAEGTLKIKYEYNIRLMLGIPGGTIQKNDGSEGEGGNLLPSGYFVLEPVKKDGKLDGYEICGGGLGHGAGMSQNGARLLAEQGYGYDEILQYFYKGIRLAILE